MLFLLSEANYLLNKFRKICGTKNKQVFHERRLYRGVVQEIIIIHEVNKVINQMFYGLSTEAV